MLVSVRPMRRQGAAGARAGTRAVRTAVLACLILAGLASPARAALYWSAPKAIAPAPLTGLSCPSASLCVGVDCAGDVVTSTDPTGGASAWSTARIAEAAPFTFALQDVSCSPDARVCVAVGSAGMYVSSDPTGGTSAWRRVAGSQQASTIACASDHLCVAGEANRVLSSTSPLAASEAWSEAFPAGLENTQRVACPSSSLCAVLGQGATIFTSGDPSGGAGVWRSVKLASSEGLVDLSCPTTSFCAAIGNEAVLTTTDPTGDASAWHAAAVPAIDSHFADRLACASPTLCAAVGGNGLAASSSDPAAGAAGWESVTEADGNNWIRAVSCPTESLCLAADEAVLIGVAAHLLTVATAGAGQGAVSSSPLVCPFGCTYSGGPACPRNCGADSFPGAIVPQRLTEIECGVNEFKDGTPFPLDFCSRLYPATDAPLLTPTPRLGSVFTGWSGACAGRGGCAPSMSEERSVTATFEPALALRAVSERRLRWREAKGRSRAPVGTRFLFSLNRPAIVELEFFRVLPGRSDGGSCRHGLPRGRGCVVRHRVGIRRVVARAGAGSVDFAGRVRAGRAERALRPGRYMVLVSASALGETTSSKRLYFTISG